MPAAKAAGFFSVPLSSAFCILTSSEKSAKKIRVFEIHGILHVEKQKGGKNMPSVEEKVNYSAIE